MPANLLLKYEDKRTILNESSLLSRLEKLLMLLRQECQVLEIERDLDDKVNASLDKGRRELPAGSRCTSSAKSWAIPKIPAPKPIPTARRLLALKLDDESTELLKRVRPSGSMQSNSAESGVIRSYLDTCLGPTPGTSPPRDDLDQAHARRVLDREHYGFAESQRAHPGTAGRAQAEH